MSHLKFSAVLAMLVGMLARVDAQDTVGIKQLALYEGPQIKFLFGSGNHDFGMIPANSTATWEFEFKNSGNKPLVIADMHADSCLNRSAVTVHWPAKPVKPGKKGLIRIEYRSKDICGTFTNKIIINSNATLPGFVLLHISGAVVPASSATARRDPDANNGFGGGLNAEGNVFAIIAMTMISTVTDAVK